MQVHVETPKLDSIFGHKDSDVDFDLAAFHALVRILKRSLRLLKLPAMW